MSEEGDSSSVKRVGNGNDLIEPNKTKHKIIRVLTVVAYVLSVSMAAILLSIYYVFMWDGHPTLARKDPSQDGHHPNMQPHQQLQSVQPQLAAYAASTSRIGIWDPKGNVDNSSNDSNVTMIMKEKEMWFIQDQVFDNTSEEITAGENVLVDVPYEPTAIPVVEAKTESPPPSTPDPIMLNEEGLNEGDWPINITFAQHLPELTKRSPMFRKLVRSSIVD